jgi:uncharacterized protein YndB with AHSA1/START domain
VSGSVDAASANEALALTRVLEAPRETVWREWTEPDRFAGWFGGTAGEVPPSSVAMDVRIGGAWRAVMCTSEGNISWHGEYRELIEPERIVFTLSTQRPPNARHALASVALAKLGEDRTEMRFEQRGSLSPGQASVARYGWARSFDRLAERLAAG